MTTSSSSTSSPTPYTPPDDLVQAAEKALAEATPEELARAEALYMAYAAVTRYRSAVTGSDLPLFPRCSSLVRAGWLAAARAAQVTPRVDTSALNDKLDAFRTDVEALVASDEGRIDPFLMGISEIASSTRDLAEAQRALASCGEWPDDKGPVTSLINDVATALHARVKALAQPPAQA